SGIASFPPFHIDRCVNGIFVRERVLGGMFPHPKFGESAWGIPRSDKIDIFHDLVHDFLGITDQFPIVIDHLDGLAVLLAVGNKSGHGDSPPRQEKTLGRQKKNFTFLSFFDASNRSLISGDRRSGTSHSSSITSSSTSVMSYSVRLEERSVEYTAPTT